MPNDKVGYPALARRRCASMDRLLLLAQTVLKRRRNADDLCTVSGLGGFWSGGLRLVDRFGKTSFAGPGAPSVGVWRGSRNGPGGGGGGGVAVVAMDAVGRKVMRARRGSTDMTKAERHEGIVERSNEGQGRGRGSIQQVESGANSGKLRSQLINIRLLQGERQGSAICHDESATQAHVSIQRWKVRESAQCVEED